MKAIFRNQQDQRLRAGWRIFLFLLLFCSGSGLIFAVKPLFPELSKREFIEGYSLLVISIIALSATLFVPIARRYLDKKTMVSLGLRFDRAAVIDIIYGFTLSGAMVFLFFMLGYIFGLFEIDQINWGSSKTAFTDYLSYIAVFSFGVLALLLLEMAIVAWWEELVFRGYLLQNMMDGMGPTVAVVISCLFYGLVHSTNPHATLLSSSIIVLFGFLRIYGYLATGMLWLSIGMHWGWNFFQGPVFGFGASGHRSVSLIEISNSSEDWLSGGNFGPEGSVLIIPILGLALWAMTARKR